MSAVLADPKKGRITARPGDDEIIDVLCQHFDDTPFGVIYWLIDMDLSAALGRDQGFDPE